MHITGEFMSSVSQGFTSGKNCINEYKNLAFKIIKTKSSTIFVSTCGD